MAAETLVLDGIVSSSGWSGVPTTPTVAQLDTNDTTYAEPANNNTNVAAIVSFPTPTGDLNTGANLQTLTVICRPNVVTPGTGTATAFIELYESGNGGNPLATSSSVNITSSSGDTTITLLWDASLLTTISGVDVQCRLVGTKSGGSPTTRISVAFDYVKWDVDYATAADACLADDLQSATQVSTPASGGTNILLADDLQSASQLSQPTSGGENALLADDLQTASQLSRPTAADIATHVLLADDLQSGSEVSQPTSGGENALLADDLQSGSEVSQPTSGGENALLADDLQSGSEVSQPASGGENTLLADDLQSGSEVSQPTSGGENALLADNLETASQISKPILVEVSGDDVLLADDLETASQLSSPVLSENVEFLRPDADSSVGNWTTDAGSSVNLYQQIDEVSANDTDYVRSELDPTTSAYKVRLSDLVESADTGAVHLVNYRYGKGDINGQRIDLTVRLIEGASTVIASWVHTDISHIVVGVEQALTGPQKTSIGDYANLFIEFEANGL